MKPMDILDALSNLPEDYAASVLQTGGMCPADEPVQNQTGEINLTAGALSPKKRGVRISKAGIAAAAALCIGLNAAMIYGISALRADSGVRTPAHSPEMTVCPETQRSDGAVPDFVGMDWKTVKQQAAAAGLLLQKQPVDANGVPAGTVTRQLGGAGEIIFCEVAADPDAPDSEISFSVSGQPEGRYYICLRNARQEIIGCSSVFSPQNVIGMIGLKVDRQPEKSALTEAILVNADTNREAVIGSYIVHQAPPAFSEEWRTYVDAEYDTVSEDIAGAFSQVQPVGE